MPRPSKSTRIQLWLARLNRFSESQLTVAEFCQREQISLPSFYQWKRRLSPRVDSPKPTGRRRPSDRSQRSTTEPVHEKRGFTELVVTPTPISAHALLPGGITITLGDQPDLAQLIVDRLLHHASEATGARERARSC